MNRFQQTGHGLGTDIVITINDTSAVSDALFVEIWSIIKQFENRFSRFKTTSEITKVNNTPSEFVQVSTEFIALVKSAVTYSNSTDGVYNPLVLGNVQRAGYKGSWPNVEQHDERLDFSDRAQIRPASSIIIHGTSVQIPSGSALDFGGIGKGFLLDKIADFLDTKHVKHYWVSLGGDIVVNGHDITDKPWLIGIGSATDTDAVINSLQNTGGKRMAIATSGITKRKGSDWHHLINPATGLPASTDILSATVSHPSATAADVLAKCIVILGSSKSEKFANQHGVLSVMSQLDTGDTLQYGVTNV